MTHICLSDDVAEPLQAIGAASAPRRGRPDEPALFATLSQGRSRYFQPATPLRI